MEMTFTYASLWSDEVIWGGVKPIDGDSVSIPPGMNLVVDENTPKLKAVIVEGALLFYPSSVATDLRTFDAEYVVVHGGRIEAGTLK